MKDGAETMFDVAPLHPLFAAEVRGIDLRAAADDDAAIDAVRRLADEFGVLVFPDQDIDDDAQLRFSERFGPLETSRRAHRPEFKKTMRLGMHFSDISNLDENERIMGPDDYRLMSLYANRLWHTDSSFKRIPARYSILAAKVLPSQGGDTEFADLRAAYDGLPDRTKAEIADKVAIHSIFNSRATIGFHDFTPEERDALPPVPQAMVRTHPGSGRTSLYIASHAGAVLGLNEPEARMLLIDLMEHATQRRYVHAHAWRPGDVVMWDNRCILHRGRWHPPEEVRELRRTTVSDEVPTVAD